MASRSLKPSYLASAAAAQGPSRSPRPSFTRTNSSSSARSDDSFVAQLKEIGVLDKNYKSLNAGTGKQRDDGNGTATRVDSTSKGFFLFSFCFSFSISISVSLSLSLQVAGRLGRLACRLAWCMLASIVGQ